jgi:hypothetical protein
VVAALTAATTACGSDAVSPSEARRRKVEARLEATFSKAQAECILGALDPTTIAALARSSALPEGSLQLTRYSDAVTVCVAASGSGSAGGSPTTSTTSAPPTTTTTAATDGGD